MKKLLIIGLLKTQRPPEVKPLGSINAVAAGGPIKEIILISGERCVEF